MPLHLLKLCVGADSIEDLELWIASRLAEKRSAGLPQQHWHTTRMVPKRIGELMDGGSLYWVIRGQLAARQVLEGVEPFKDADGIGRCRLVLEPRVVQVLPRPFRPFQGWRYLKAEDAPADLDDAGEGLAALPETLRRELRDLGLL